MEGQTVTTVFPKTNEEKLIEFQGAVYELEEALRKLDELQRCEVAEKEAALAETLNMKKLAGVKIGDAYDTLTREDLTTREEVKGGDSKQYEGCGYCGHPSKSGICFRCIA